MKKVFLDFGHGGEDPGAVSQGLKEKDIVLSIGTKVKKHLERCKIQVNTSRDIDKTVSLEQRCTSANSIGSNCFVSIHCNSFSSSSAKGLEVYSSASSTKDLATILYNQLVKDNLYNSKRGVKHNNFYVLKNTKMRAALIELGFISNIEDVKLLKEKQDEFAQSIAQGICTYLEIKYIKEFNENSTADVMYRVVVGSYSSKENAVNMKNKAISKGFIDTFICIK